MTIWNGYLNKEYILVCKTCPYAKVLVFVKKGQKDPTPWKEWADIFQLFASPDKPWRVGFFPSKVHRMLPEPGQPVGPENVNGGYTFPCSTNGIIIYREEEATRVLIHELFHATCCDRAELCTEDKEAETESWAELTIIAYVAVLRKQKPQELFIKQLQWMGVQNTVLRQYYGIQSPNDYVWRYTLGREDAFYRLGIEVPSYTKVKLRRSNRLTHPSLEI